MNNFIFKTLEEFAGKFGIKVEYSEGPLAYVFLPGVETVEGCIYYNEEANPGSLLHEIAHLAVTPSVFRNQLEEDFENFDPMIFLEGQCEESLFLQFINGDEFAANAWSYAAAIRLGLTNDRLFVAQLFSGSPPDFGYSSLIKRQLETKCYCGISALCRIGMLDTQQNYPNLIRWVQI